MHESTASSLLVTFPPDQGCITEDLERDPCPAWLIEAVYEVVHRSSVRAPRIAELMGCSVDLLYAWATDPTNKSGKHWHLPTYRLVPLIMASQNYALLDVIEAQVGRQAQRVQLYQLADLPRGIAESVGQAGNLISLFAKTLEDGNVTSAEAKALHPVMRAFQEQLARLETAIALRESQE